MNPIPWIRFGLVIVARARVLAPVIMTASGIIIRVGIGSLRAPARFVRSIFNPRAGQKVLNAEQKTFVRDITPITRSAMQIRAMPKFVARQTYNFARYYAPRKVLAETRKVVRDVLSPLYTSIHAYQFYRLTRIASARTSAVERGLDKALWGFGRAMRPLKLTPKFSYTIRSYVRIAAAGTIYHEGRTFVNALKSGYGRAAESLRNPQSQPVYQPPESVTAPTLPVETDIRPDDRIKIVKPIPNLRPPMIDDRKPKIRRPIPIKDRPITPPALPR